VKQPDGAIVYAPVAPGASADELLRRVGVLCGEDEAVAPAMLAFHDEHDDAVVAVGENRPFHRRHLHQVGPGAVPDHLAVRFVERESPLSEREPEMRYGDRAVRVRSQEVDVGHGLRLVLALHMTSKRYCH
jgi:hypothetical protein